MSITREEANKCLKSLMRVLIIKGGDKYWPAKNTSRQDAYRALYEIQEALGTRRLVQGEALLENMQDLDLALSTFLTRGEIIGAYEEAAVSIGLVASQGDKEAERTYEIIRAGLNALRGPTREKVERMRGEWVPAESDFDDDDALFDVDDWCDWQCSACYSDICYDDPMERRWLPKFCPNCGSPMTDEAVDMMLERWKEALE